MDDLESELEEIRERKRRELMEGGCDAESEAPGEPVEIRGEEHLNELTSRYSVVLVDFYADWCGPCKIMEPAVREVARESSAAVAKVDIDRQQRLASKYGVRSVPTIVLFRDSEPEGQMVGAQDKQTLMDLVERNAPN